MGQGRPAKPIHMHLVDGNKNKLTKSEIESRKEAEKQIVFSDDKIKGKRITPPTWLSAEAKKIYRQLIKEFEHNDVLKNVDIHSVAMFADAYRDYIEMTEIINRDGMMMEHTNKSGASNTIPHPLYTKKKALFDQMQKVMAEIGLTPSARAKLAIPTKLEQVSDKLSLFGDTL
ncbi:P27 family predicted phage terminase small subunit [Virgibacillus halotolerans]|uniref:phage terminase small subunit P27 family n=1 Tax=Virgibacillus halotolerans TaxID=1071053 RepID=UPI001960BA4D|nr:phage terminase small subunit P27 family [Virgibacillus halotolerans]MBM7598480.1 P27 family predicted phage terminase small subunit [Virgibacillus halotolerans]